MNSKTAEDFKRMLFQIYPCKVPFELLLIDKRPKTRMGVYIIKKKRIRIYTSYKNICPLEEIAIHEYAHHIHETENRKNYNRRQERAHGPEFWRIYSALMSVAQLKGLFEDHYISNIINQIN